MAFYIRRGLNFGPFRLNLSKSGLGISAGVTGARIGITSQGRTYVHGGRHGLYYRKYLDGGSGHSSRNSDRVPQDLFEDTGLTFPVINSITVPIAIPNLPEKPGYNLLIVSAALGVIAILIQTWSFRIAVAVLAAGMLVIYLRNFRYHRRLTALFHALIPKKDDQELAEIWIKETAWMRADDLKPLAETLYYNWLGSQAENMQFEATDKYGFLPVSDGRREELALFWYRQCLTELLADHELTEDENDKLLEVEKLWNIPSEAIVTEKALMNSYRELREILSSPIKAYPLSRELKRGETGYFETSGMLLNQIVLARWQSNNVPYRKVGYRIDLSGNIRVTSRVLEIDPGNRIREYRLNDIEDVFLNPDEGIIELNLRNRQSKLIFTSPRLLMLAGMIEKAIEEHN